MTLKRLSPEDPRLRQVCEDMSLAELRRKEMQKTIDSLLDFVFQRNNKGPAHNKKKPTIIGLSANQVGVMKRICIVDLAIRRKGYSEIHVLVNPHITWRSKTMQLRKEGCVNLPNIWGYVPRSIKIDVSYLDRWGNSYEMRAVGWAATLIQHEVDHLNGLLFIDRIEDPKKALHVEESDFLAYKKDPKKWDKYIDVSKLTRAISK
ncbi:MAG: peptide deformylase [Candidatus Levybacteria bacterium]|nr:peptide deformylase [Candidatus Levybacteria bacterium]